MFKTLDSQDLGKILQAYSSRSAVLYNLRFGTMRILAVPTIIDGTNSVPDSRSPVPEGRPRIAQRFMARAASMIARTLFTIVAIIWALPYTLLGLLLGLAGLCTGGRARIRGRVIEFYGGGVKWLLQRFFFGNGATAFTLGHAVLGQTAPALDIARRHELVHVRQFERWGPLMGPAYLGCSLVLWLTGRRPYCDNPFERQAYEEGDRE